MAAINVVFFTSHSLSYYYTSLTSIDTKCFDAWSLAYRPEASGWLHRDFLFIMFTDWGRRRLQKDKIPQFQSFLLRFKPVIYIPSRLIHFLSSHK